ncbi:cuticle protein AMP1A-like [Macrobrachium rosenbergii]|uniref:cuticle protein AMP1A-like n=1 Tax=Macrobrachium rosenbergii TaxID=79674 RepID=UPI0034D58433
MKPAILAVLVAVAFGAPQDSYRAPAARSFAADGSFEVVPILRDERAHEDDGRYNFDIESANGIKASESGSPTGPKGTVVSAGEYSFTAPDGTDVVVRYVADENGFQPQSDLLPVAPEFPHPIPQFVLDQIAFAAEEDRRNPRRESEERSGTGRAQFAGYN